MKDKPLDIKSDLSNVDESPQNSKSNGLLVGQAQTVRSDAEKTNSEVLNRGQSLEKELNGPKGLEPTRYGDWESKGRCYDF